MSLILSSLVIAVIFEGTFLGFKVTSIDPCNFKQEPLVDFAGVWVEAIQEFLDSIEKLSSFLPLRQLLFASFFASLLSLVFFNITVLDRVSVKEISRAALARFKQNLVEQGGDPIQPHHFIQVLLLHEALACHDKLFVPMQLLTAPV